MSLDNNKLLAAKIQDITHKILTIEREIIVVLIEEGYAMEQAIEIEIEIIQKYAKHRLEKKEKLFEHLKEMLK